MADHTACRAGAAVLALAGTLATGACSDGGSDDPPAPPAGNSAPVFTSAAAVTIDENTGGTVYTATATDADGDALSFSVTGGADAGVFETDLAGGALVGPATGGAFDFENPADANGDNVYEVEITVTDGAGGSDVLALSLTVADLGEGVALTQVGTGFDQPLFVRGFGAVGAKRAFVVEKGGDIEILDIENGVIENMPLLDIPDNQIGSSSEGGLLGFALAPDFSFTNGGAFYVCMTTDAGGNDVGDTEIRRYETTPAAPLEADAASFDVILSVPQPAGNHNGGWLDFGPDGFLYIALGDGGGGGDPFENGQDTDTLLGNILRIDVTGDDFPGDVARDYAIPADNPFVGGGGLGEIWAYGLRNPFRASFDVGSGDLILGDVGQSEVEEIDIAPAGVGGLNFGWDLFEGTEPFEGASSAGLTPPALEYRHDNAPFLGSSITGGYAYRGAVEGLQGQYVFGDFVSGNIFTVSLNALRTSPGVLGPGDFAVLTDTVAPDVGDIDNVVSFGVDPGDGSPGAQILYVVDFGGEIYRFDPGP